MHSVDAELGRLALDDAVLDATDGGEGVENDGVTLHQAKISGPRPGTITSRGNGETRVSQLRLAEVVGAYMDPARVCVSGQDRWDRNLFP